MLWGEQTDIVWTAEIDAEVLKQDDWATLLGSVPEDPGTFSAYLHTFTWNTASAAAMWKERSNFLRGADR